MVFQIKEKTCTNAANTEKIDRKHDNLLFFEISNKERKNKRKRHHLGFRKRVFGQQPCWQVEGGQAWLILALGRGEDAQLYEARQKGWWGH